MQYNLYMFGVDIMPYDPNKDLHYDIKTRVFYDEPVFGPGVVRIMELVKETGSLLKAYNIMGLSSSKGWKIIKRAEEDLGYPLIISMKGGSGGGKSELSTEGHDILNRYNAFISELHIESDRLFKKHFT